MPEFKRPTATVPLYQSADQARIDELRADLMAEASQTVTTTRLLSDTEPQGADELRAKAQAHDDFVREAEGRAVRIVVQALPRKRWRALEDKHPARMIETKVRAEDGTERTTEEPHADDRLGFNLDTMADDLVPESLPLVTPDGEVQFASEDERAAFLDALSAPHFDAIYAAAIRLNTEGGSVPKAEASSLVDRIIAATSTSLAASA